MKTICSLCHRPIDVLLLCAVFLIPATSAFAAEAPPKLKPGTYMPVSAIKAGMKGIGKTAFRGAKPETFRIEVLGVVPKAFNGEPLIIVRMEGGPITERGSGIASGMSGSPVYIDGKIVGATAIGYGWMNDKIAGVTPIEAMFRALDASLPTEPTDFASAGTFDFAAPVELGGTEYTKLGFSDESPTDRDSGVLYMRRWRPQVVVSEGLSGFLPELKTLFPNAEFSLTGSHDPELMEESPLAGLEAGSPMGMFYLWGDLQFGALGTATYVDDGWFLAFGHPMSEIGPINAPVTSAYITDFFPSLAMSHKIGYPVEVVGMTTQDSPWSVAGRLGKAPDMIPIEIEVEDKELGRERVFNLWAVKHPEFTSMMLRLGLAAAISLVRTIEADSTATVSFEMETDGLGVIERENVFFSPTTATVASDDLSDLVGILFSNPFGPASIKGLKAKVEIEGGHKEATIEAISAQRPEFEPGETIDIDVRLRPYRGDPIKMRLSLPVPDDAPTTDAVVTVRGGTVKEVPVVNGVQIRPRGPGLEAQRLGYGTTSLDQIVSRYLEQPKNDEIIASLSLGRSFPVVSGETLGVLPAAFAPTFKAPQVAGGVVAEERIYARASTEWVVTGIQTLDLKIKSPHEEKAPEGRPSQGEEAPAEEGGELAPPEESGDGLASWETHPVRMAQDAEEPEDEPAATEPKGEPKEAAKPLEERGGTIVPEQKDSGGEEPQAEGEKPLIRQPKQWTQTKKEEFEAGELAGVSCGSEGKLRVVHKFAKLCDIPAKVIWSLVPDGSGGVYAATGHEGKVFHITSDGETKPLLETGDIEVFSLCRAADGTLYAGTGPGGKVFKVGSTGESTLVADLEESYVLALSGGADGEVYAGVGPHAKVYRIDPDGSATVIFTPEKAQHVMSLACAPDGTLYIGTGDEGKVYRRGQDGSENAIFDSKQAYVTALDFDAEGNLYIGCSPKGTVTKIKPDGEAAKLLEAEAGVTGLIAERGIAAVATLDTAFMADEKVNAPLDAEKNLQITGICAGVSGSLYLATSNPATIWFAPFPQDGSIESSVFDSGEGSRWSTVSWSGHVPGGSSLALKTRTGNTSEPDETWSQWSLPYSDLAGEAVASPEGRFIQYRAELAGPAELRSVTVSYLPRNSEPTIEFEEPSAQVAWSGKKTIKWKGSDPDDDKLEYSVSYSADGGKSWLELSAEVKEEGLEAPSPEQPTETQEESARRPGGEPPFDLSPEEIEAKNRADVPKMFPDIPPEDLDKMVADALAEFERAKQAHQEAAGEGEIPPHPESPAEQERPKEKSSAEWDTTKVSDGVYILKVVATDKAGNPEGWLEDEIVSDPITVCNTPPEVWLPRSGVSVEGAIVRLRGTISQKVVAVTGVEWRVDEGDWRAAVPSDGIFDTGSERFEITTDALKPGDHKIEVQAWNSAGLKASIEHTMTIAPE